MIKTRLGTNEDGSPHYHYAADALVYTGPNISGTAVVTHPDGTEFEYDVSDLYTEVFPGHELPLAEAVAQRFLDEGHPSHDADVPFVATPVDLTHDGEGSPRASFAKLVEAQAAAGKDSSPQGVIAAATARTKTGD